MARPFAGYSLDEVRVVDDCACGPCQPRGSLPNARQDEGGKPSSPCLPLLTPDPIHIAWFNHPSGPLASVSISMHSLNEYSSGPGTATPSACGPARAASARRWRTSRGPVRHPRVWTWMKVPEVWRRRYRVESCAARGAEGCEEGRRCCESWPPGLGAFVRVSASSVGGVGDAFQCCPAKSQGAQRRGVPNLEGAKTHTTSPLPNVPSKCPPVKLIQLNLRASRSSARVLSQPPSLSRVGPSASSAPLQGPWQPRLRVVLPCRSSARPTRTTERR